MSHILHTTQVYHIVRTKFDPSTELGRVIGELDSTGQLYLSAVTNGNILSAIDSMTDASLMQQARQNYGSLLAFLGTGSVLAFDEPVSERWARLRVAVPSKQFKVAAETLMIAATAQFYGFKLICGREDWHSQTPGISFVYV